MSRLEVRPATEADIPALTAVFAESFHPVSPYMRRAVPDTPTTRQWWRDVHRDALKDPGTRLLVVTESSQGRIVALARYRTDGADCHRALDAGTWTRMPLSADHDRELCDCFIGFLATKRDQYMRGRAHRFVELVATVHEFKGSGAGRLLLEWICRDADEAGQEVFVEVNGSVVKFYERFGFAVKETEVMPGGFGYEEFIMIRAAKEAA